MYLGELNVVWAELISVSPRCMVERFFCQRCQRARTRNFSLDGESGEQRVEHVVNGPHESYREYEGAENQHHRPLANEGFRLVIDAESFFYVA